MNYINPPTDLSELQLLSCDQREFGYGLGGDGFEWGEDGFGGEGFGYAYGYADGELSDSTGYGFGDGWMRYEPFNR
jgi:hypothetical protein